MGRTKLSHSPVRQTDSSDSKRLKKKKKKGTKATIFDLLMLQQLADFCTPFFPCLSSSTCPASSIDVNIKLWKVELPCAEFILLSIFRTREKWHSIWILYSTPTAICCQNHLFSSIAEAWKLSLVLCYLCFQHIHGALMFFMWKVRISQRLVIQHCRKQEQNNNGLSKSTVTS